MPTSSSKLPGTTRSTIRLVRPLVMVIKISFQFLVPSSQFVWAWPTATL